jgi:hypothetical protein
MEYSVDKKYALKETALISFLTVFLTLGAFYTFGFTGIASEGASQLSIGAASIAIGALIFFVFYGHARTMHNMKIKVSPSEISFIHKKQTKAVPIDEVEKLISVNLKGMTKYIIIKWKDGTNVKLRGYSHFSELSKEFCKNIPNSIVEEGYGKILKYSL